MKPANSLRMPSGSWPRWLAAAGVLLALGLGGCGSDGGTGPAGSSGTNTDSGITSGTTLTAVDNAPGVVIAVTSVTGQTGPGGNFQVGDKPSVTFTVKKSNGTPWHLSEMSSGRIMLSGPTFNYQRVIPSQSDLITRSVVNGDGSYTYTFATGFPATYLAPLNDSATHGANDGELQGQSLLAGTYTIGLVTYWNYTVDGVAKRDVGNKTHEVLFGTATLAARQVVKNDNCNTCHVKIQAHGGSYQDTGICVLCHTAGAEDLSAAYPAAVGRVPGTRIEFKMMIHRIHNGVHLPSVNGVATNNDGSRNYAAPVVGNVIIGRNGTPADFSGATFPVWPSFSSSMPRDLGYSLSTTNKTKETAILRGVVACYKCHGDADGPGALTAPSQGALHTTQASRRACGSCHDDIDWTKPYTANGMTMPPQADDASCTDCHAPTGMTGIAVTGGTVPSTPFAHIHPLADSTRITGADTYNKDLVINVTSVTGKAGAFFVAGEKPVMNFTIKDNTGVDVPLYKMSQISATVTGPNNNRQLVFPVGSIRGNTAPICDFSGRLITPTIPAVPVLSTAPKGSMSRVVGSTASDVLKVQFTDSTHFYVSKKNATGSSTLISSPSIAMAAATSTNPSGSAISAIELVDDPAFLADTTKTVTVTFSDSTNFTVAGGYVSGTGVLPSSASGATTRFTSTYCSFNLAAGSTAFANGNTFTLTLYKTSVGDHAFAIVSGLSPFAAEDRFYYETVQNSLTSYTYAVPMDIVLEFQGLGNGGAQSFTVPNSPIYQGREAVYEAISMADGAATLASTTVSTATAVNALTMTVASSANFAANDQIVLDWGTSKQESVLVATVPDATHLTFQTPLKQTHAVATAVKRAMRQTTIATTAPAIRDRFIVVADATSYIAGDVVALNLAGGVGTAEFLTISKVVSASSQLWFQTPLRYAHSIGDSVQKVALQQRLETTDYTISGTPLATINTTAIANGNPVVVTYRTEGAFGWKRHAGDTRQDVYQPPQDDSPTLGLAWGEWQGKAFKSGTYTAGIWASLPTYVTVQNETQTYPVVSKAGLGNFLYGAAGTLAPYNLVSSQANCDACHDGILFHGGNRKGNDTCVLCHGIAGLEDNTQTGIPAKFAVMLHKIHMGADLPDKSTYSVNGSAGLWATVEFPAMPGGAKACTTCHGAANDSWKVLASHSYDAVTTPAKDGMMVCGSCHDTAATATHIDAMTTGAGAESCVTCHGAGQVFGIDTVHKNR